MSSRTFTLTKPHMTGDDIKAFQRDLSERFASWEIDRSVDDDGDYGIDTRHAARQVCRALGLDGAAMEHGVTPELRKKIRNPALRTKAEVEHERKHLVEHPARTERAQAFEQRRQLAQIVHRAGVRSIGMRRAVADEEHHVGAAGTAELDTIAVRQLVLGDGLAVDVGAVSRALVAKNPVGVLLDDLGVLARHVAADQAEIALGAAADAEQFLVDGDNALAEAVVDFQTGVRLRHMEDESS